ncbi:mucin-13 isoform X2 [Syngnathus acus]|uniref:mucin-13 isoform X2 n=1 Tax=Syngnathus acus TaxID=161584 RepID=UPI0018864E2C|nr:mucin-13 isoform X2 [Syngnathus acus]
MTTTGLTNDPTSVTTISLTNYTSLTTTSWTNSSTSPMTTTGLSNDTTSTTTIGPTDGYTSPTTTGPTFTTAAGPTDSTTTIGPTDSYTSPTTSGPTFTTAAGPTDSTTTIGPTDSYTSPTTTGPTFTTAAGPTDSTTTTGPPDRTTWMTPAEATTAVITTSPSSTLSVDATTRTTTGPQSDKVTRTTETSAVVSTNGPTPASEATSGATTREATSVLTPTSASKATQSSPGPTQNDATIVCPAEQCPLESVCLNRTCQCLSGSFLLGQRCVRAQVFPGRLHLTSLTFDKEMLDRSSQVFRETAADISASLAGAFAGRPGYVRSNVVQLAPGSVLATVNNIFDNTQNSEEAVEQVIQDAIRSSSQGLLLNATFSGTKLCDQVPLPCDAVTTWCTSAKGRVGCSCKAGYISTVYSNTSCKACPSGQEVVGNSCQICAFGYAGFNCTDSSLLALVVISCVLGGILLIIIILALLSYCCWRRCSGGQAEHSDPSPYPAGGELTKPWPVGITPIPRATTATAATWDAAATMEMMEKGHHGNGVSGSYDLNPDGMKTFTNKNPSRYSYLMQGHENPYFLPGDDKKN